MFKIPQISSANYYIDSAIEDMQEYAVKVKENIDRRFEKVSKNKTNEQINIDKRKDLELEKVRYLNRKANNQLKKIVKRFPDMNNIEEIYKKLINSSDVKIEDIQDSLRRFLWIRNRIDEFSQNTEFKIKKAKTQQTINFIMKKYLGKISSLYKKNKEFFITLDNARKIMNKLPKFLDIYTIGIGGYPNVGKSTLMKKITGSEVEIQNYPFTTKGLMFGYIKNNNERSIQLIDTPGLLGRDKNNNIEQKAQIILHEYSNLIVFVIDFTQSCGYNIESQIKLFKKTKQFQNDIVIYLSKADIFDEEALERKKEYKNVLLKNKTFDDYKKLKKYLIEQKGKNKKFSVNDINVIK